jgi:hypothetical protein
MFLALIDALLEHVQMNTRMDIRDRIAALALVDRVLAREKTDADAERVGSKVREYSGSFREGRAAANGPGPAADPRRRATSAPQDEPDAERGSGDDDEANEHETPDHVSSAR